MRFDGLAACGMQWNDTRSHRYARFHIAKQNDFLMNPAPSTPLSNLITEATPLSPPDRAKLLETSSDLAAAHASAASGGDTTAPSADDPIDLHFVAFVKSPENNLWELDGSRKGPLNRGKLPQGEDILGEKAIQLGPKRFLTREQNTPGGEMRFSILALGPSFG